MNARYGFQSASWQEKHPGHLFIRVFGLVVAQLLAKSSTTYSILMQGTVFSLLGKRQKELHVC